MSRVSLDCVVRGGHVVDGTGVPAFAADVGVAGGRIVAVGDLGAVDARRVLDAAGHLVVPGFIDIHSHSDFTLLVDSRAQSAIAQGVTTEVIGNCGHGCAPIANPELVRSNVYGYGPHVPMSWATTAEYFDRLAAARPAVNVAALVPNGNLRLGAVGLADRPATPDERRRMEWLLREGLEAGAFGFSSGLEYPIERGCSEEELTELGRIVGKMGRLYATHTRNREVHAIAAIEEAMRVAAAAEVRLQISHILPRRGGPPRAGERALAAVDGARARGVDVAFDSHTRLYGITTLSSALPPELLDGGQAAMAARLRDRASREALKRHESIITSFGLGGWDRVFLFKSEQRPDLAGKSFLELAGGGDPLDAVFDVLLASISDPHEPMVICHSYEEDDLELVLRHPSGTVGSDATALCPDGPLAGSTFLGAYTWAAWFFRWTVRERRIFGPEEAVHVLTGRTAERVRLRNRGRIAVGTWADLVVLDPGQFGEQGTLQAPNQLAQGVLHVLVNGKVTMEDGKFTGEHGGAVLRCV